MERPNILSLIASIFKIARRQNWSTLYDKGSDCLYWSKKNISKDAELIQFLDDFSLYITRSGKIEGLFIEYANNNFMSHHREFRPLINAMKQKGGKCIYILPKKDEDKVEHLLEGIADKVAKETLELVANGFKINEILKMKGA